MQMKNAYGVMISVVFRFGSMNAFFCCTTVSIQFLSHKILPLLCAAKYNTFLRRRAHKAVVAK